MHEPPNAAQIARRLLCLEVLVFRAEMEIRTLAGDQGGLREAQSDLESDVIPWLHENDLWHSLTKSESELIVAPIGSWDQGVLADASWKSVCCGVLTWALSEKGVLARIDEPFMMPSAPREHDPKTFIGSARKRTQSEIEREREIAELWHWRASIDRLQASGAINVEPEQMEHAMRSALVRAAQLGVPVLEDDLSVHGRKFRELDRELKSVQMSIAIERHRSLNWLCGYAIDWDDVPLDT